MAVDKLVDSAQLDSDLTSVANAIRTKGGTSAQMAFPAGFVSAVQAIPTGITPTGTKQISITQNGTTTHDVTNYASAEITVNVSGGGGSGLVTIASGTFVGDNTQFATVAIGKKMAQTDFFVKIKPQANSEYPYDTNYKFANIALIVFSGFAHFDLSTDGEKKTATSDLSYPVNNSGTITNVVVGDALAIASNIRNASGTKNGGINQFKITKNSSGFSLYTGHSNASYKFLSTITFDWEIVYFGSNPTTDIVEVA